MAKNKSKLLALADVLLNFAEVIISAGNVLAILTPGSPENQRAALINQGVALKNRLTARKIETEENRTAITANQIVHGDQKIKRQELELALLRETVRIAGLLNSPGAGNVPQFTALNYHDPGDVRRGKLPPPEEMTKCNKF